MLADGAAPLMALGGPFAGYVETPFADARGCRGLGQASGVKGHEGEFKPF